MIPTTIVYSPSSNIFRLRLLEKGNPVNLGGLTKIDLVLGNGNTISSDNNPYAFDWLGNGKGVLTLRLGSLDLIDGVYNSELVVYDGLNYQGVFWGFFRIRVIGKNG